MKLVTYESENVPRAGVVVDEQVLEVATLLGEQGGLRDVRALLELPNDPLTRLKSALGSARAAQGVPLNRVRLRAPILQPPTVRDFMVYEGHASGGGTRQLSDAWYRLPIFYFSNPLCIFGPEDAIPYPSASEQLDYELELAAVIGREASNVAEADAFSYIAGFTIFNDWSCRDLQRDEMEARLGPAKGKDSASSLGPWIVTTDELASFVRDGPPARALHVESEWRPVDGKQRRHHVSHLGCNDRARLTGQPSRSWRRTWRGYGHRRVDRRGDTQRIPSALSRTRGHRGDRGRRDRRPAQHYRAKGEPRPQLSFQGR